MSQNKNAKAKYWTAVLYPESMIDNWEIKIGDVLQYPYAYCLHDKCVTSDGEPRKPHVHVIMAFSNTTTYNHAKSIFEGLGVCNKIERVISIRNAYDYLIHDTESSKKQGKFLYKQTDRITGNDFDIGAYEQLSVVGKLQIKKELANIIRELHFFNFDDFDAYVSSELPLEYFQVMCENQSYFNNIVTGHYKKIRGIVTGEYHEFQKKIDAMKSTKNDEEN